MLLNDWDAGLGETVDREGQSKAQDPHNRANEASAGGDGGHVVAFKKNDERRKMKGKSIWQLLATATLSEDALRDRSRRIDHECGKAKVSWDIHMCHGPTEGSGSIADVEHEHTSIEYSSSSILILIEIPFILLAPRTPS